MSEAKQAKETNKQDEFIKDFFAADAVQFDLVYQHKGEKITFGFDFRLAYESDEQAAREMYLKNVSGDKGAANHNYNVEIVAKISNSLPSGFPGLIRRENINEPASDYDLIKAYFGDFKDKKKVKIINDALMEFFRVTQPETLFR